MYTLLAFHSDDVSKQGDINEPKTIYEKIISHVPGLFRCANCAIEPRMYGLAHQAPRDHVDDRAIDAQWVSLPRDEEGQRRGFE